MIEDCTYVGGIERRTASRCALCCHSLGRPGFCGGIVDVNGEGVLRVAVDNIYGVCMLFFKVTTGAPLIDRERNTYLRKVTLDVHLIKRSEEVVSCEEAKKTKRATSGRPLVVMSFAFPTSPKTTVLISLPRKQKANKFQ